MSAGNGGVGISLRITLDEEESENFKADFLYGKVAVELLLEPMAALRLLLNVLFRLVLVTAVATPLF